MASLKTSLTRLLLVLAILAGDEPVAGGDLTAKLPALRPAEGFTQTGIIPAKIFTPNGDGVNDVITLYFDNPEDSVVVEARVYDLSGAFVADLQAGSVADSFAWDGRDAGGRAAAGGVYIYRIEAENKRFTGTVVVVR